MNILSEFKKINTFIFDVDGVLTNGDLIVNTDGNLLRTMNIKDGYAMQLAIKKGYNIIIISGGKSELVRKRLEGLKITNNHFAVENKIAKLNELQLAYNLELENCIYVGDDMPDVEAMKQVGLPCCPSDACNQVKEIAKYISPNIGGKGCARDIIEKVLTLNGHWE